MTHRETKYVTWMGAELVPQWLHRR